MSAETFVFLGSARCFHTIDWYDSAEITLGYAPYFIADQINGEGFPCLVKDQSKILPLLKLDKILFRSQSRFSHQWRNILKILVVPLQIIILRWYNYRLNGPVFFAHSTYYAFLAHFAGIKYISTPQGSEVLVRPDRSKVYRWFAKIAHKSAELVTVDSAAMGKKLMLLFNQKSIIIQNGIDMKCIRSLVRKEEKPKKFILSLRGMQENYQIIKLLDERNSFSQKLNLNFCFPFHDEDYLVKAKTQLLPSDVLHGRLSKIELYELLRQTKIVISIPKSDSSPRSVYEAIFFGCIVIAINNDYIRSLPEMMRERIVITDCQPGWLSLAVKEAELRLSNKFEPKECVVNLFDQEYSIKRVLEAYKVI
jgi:glycosyltransferase involved in cell wall biosynthesis